MAGFGTPYRQSLRRLFCVELQTLTCFILASARVIQWYVKRFGKENIEIERYKMVTSTIT